MRINNCMTKGPDERCMAMGADPVTRQRILGHAQPDMTEQVYGHTYDSLKQAAMKKLDMLFYTSQEREYS